MPTPVAASKAPTPIVDYVRDDVLYELDRWALIRDCLAGEKEVKARREKYLPKPNPEDTSNENKLRYDSYLQRAVFYNVTRRTLDGLVGQVYMRAPIINLPENLTVLEEDIDGAGVSLVQQGKKCLSSVMSYGRAGLLVDYPPTTGTVSRAEQEAGYVRPTITLYDPWQIINWRTITVGGKKLLSLVVLREQHPENDNGYYFTYQRQWRVLRLTSTELGLNYIVEIWREGHDEAPIEIYTPQDANGNPLTEIPFIFVGALNNDSILDQPPLYDLASLNIAHYRNSADYEEACYIVGQPTPYFAGLTKSWVEEVFKGKVMLGSRSAIPLPENGSAGLLQVNTNTMPKEAMDAKERQMVALGAKLVEQRDVQRTYGEAMIETAAETSILATAAKNVADAYEQGLKWCATFDGSTTEGIEYELNTDFPAARMSSEDRAELVAEWQAGAITWEEMRSQLRKAGVVYEEDESARSDIEKDELRQSSAGIGFNPGNSKTGGTANDRVAPEQDGKTQQ